ncbi:uncharacterized protein LOC101156623 isoform X2 [Oryzias latipes]
MKYLCFGLCPLIVDWETPLFEKHSRRRNVAVSHFGEAASTCWLEELVKVKMMGFSADGDPVRRTRRCRSFHLPQGPWCSWWVAAAGKKGELRFISMETGRHSGWNDMNVAVMCRQLGHSGRATAAGGFGQGKGPLHLDQVAVKTKPEELSCGLRKMVEGQRRSHKEESTICNQIRKNWHFGLRGLGRCQRGFSLRGRARGPSAAAC